MYLTRFRTYKIALPPPNKNLGGQGASDRLTPANMSLYKSVFKKCRHLGLESCSYLVHALFHRLTLKMFYYLFRIRTLQLGDLHYRMYLTQMYVCSLYVKYSQANLAFCKANFFFFYKCVAHAAGKHSMKLLVSQLTSKVSPGSVSWVQIPQLRSVAGICLQRLYKSVPQKLFFHAFYNVK
jgi:hypothetical protein